MMYRLNYNPNNNNNELQESPIILPNSKPAPAPPSTKKVWRLKKYHRSEDEIKTQQQDYENLEFNTKKTSTRRPKNKNGGQQEFVFVDLSPKKKVAAPKDDKTATNSPSSTTTTTTPTTSKKQGRVSRLFRLNNTNDEVVKEQSAPASLMSSPTHHYQNQTVNQKPIPKGKIHPISTIPSLPPQQQYPAQAPIQPPALKRSYTTANAARYNDRSGSSTSLVMTVSENGRAVLQPTASRTLSTSSSVSDLFSLTRMNSTRQSPIPSPKRMESPIHQQHLVESEYSDYDHEDSSEHDYDDGDCDEPNATKAFSKILKKQSSSSGTNAARKRANTAGSTNSNISSPVVPRLLTRNHSISSMNSIYKSRMGISPSRSNMVLRQTALLQQQHQQPLYSPQEQNEFEFTSFFDDVNNNNHHHTPSSRSNFHSSGSANYHKKTISISDNLAQLGPPLEINSSDNDPESPYTANTDVMLPFECSSGGLDHTTHIAEDNDHDHHHHHHHHFTDETLKVEQDDHQFFDFNAFINFNDQSESHY